MKTLLLAFAVFSLMSVAQAAVSETYAKIAECKVPALQSGKQADYVFKVFRTVDGNVSGRNLLVQYSISRGGGVGYSDFITKPHSVHWVQNNTALSISLQTLFELVIKEGANTRSELIVSAVGPRKMKCDAALHGDLN